MFCFFLFTSLYLLCCPCSSVFFTLAEGFSISHGSWQCLFTLDICIPLCKCTMLSTAFLLRELFFEIALCKSRYVSCNDTNSPAKQSALWTRRKQTPVITIFSETLLPIRTLVLPGYPISVVFYNGIRPREHPPCSPNPLSLHDPGVSLVLPPVYGSTRPKARAEYTQILSGNHKRQGTCYR